MLPPPISEYSFLSFDCSYLASTGCTFVGQGPIVVAHSSMTVPESSEITETVDYTGGFDEDSKAALLDSAIPQVGDVLIAVNGMCVTHLTHTQFSRLAKRIRQRHPRDPLRLSFRRFHVLDESKVRIFCP
jgi:hypothetical protein